MKGPTTTLNPYLTFAGNCREAMNFYKEALDGQLEILPFEGNPVDVPEDYKDKVMHATLRFGDAVVMASDAMPGQPVEHGNANALSIACPTIAEAERFYKNLSDGGTIIMPFEKTFWNSMFGYFTDKFGVSWMVNSEQNE